MKEHHRSRTIIAQRVSEWKTVLQLTQHRSKEKCYQNKGSTIDVYVL